MSLPRLTLVLGGARSGKSSHAEALVTATPAPWTYIATAQAFDDEMRTRIAAHRARRGAGWKSIEAPVDLARALSEPPVATPVLVDCLTLWLSNLMLGDYDLRAATARFEQAIAARRGPAVLVSNEVGLGIVPETKLGRDFRDAAGLLHQRLAAQANRVVLMVAGLPMIVKDTP